MIDKPCYMKAEKVFFLDQNVDNCQCIPDCTSISYEMDISQAPRIFDKNANISYDTLINGLGNLQSLFFINFDHRILYFCRSYTVTRLFMSFKESYFISINRLETSTMPDFISSCGGLLGLFMGISVLSIIEFVYYFTLRLCCQFRRQKTSIIDSDEWARRTRAPDELEDVEFGSN